VKSFKVVLTRDAEEDLRDIVGFIDGREGEIRADHVLTQFEAIVSQLETFPTKNRVVKELEHIGITEFREVYFKPYRVIYRVATKQVDVYLICDGRRDMIALLQAHLLRAR
jgi:toxin ParE1/3/4